VVQEAPGERSGFPPFAGLTLTAITTCSHAGRNDRNSRPGLIWHRATAPGRSRLSPSALGAVVIRRAFHAPAFERLVASTASRLASVTIAIRPSSETGCVGI
jgi:hypothetical protein